MTTEFLGKEQIFSARVLFENQSIIEKLREEYS